MKYTKEQRLEMLREMWNEANEEFARAMSEKRLDDSRKSLDVMELASKLVSHII